MFLRFFETLRDHDVPVTLREFLTFLEGLSRGLTTYDIDGFYYFSRAAMVKDERHIDKFDRAFSKSFEGIEDISSTDMIDALDLPQDWLEKLAEKTLTEEERAEIKSLGGFDELMETLKQRLEEQKKRHQGGNKWIGTAGTSPFGAYGYNPEGVRIGQTESRHKRAVKVWDKREFKDLDGDVQLGTRNIKVALKRLRNWARDGAEDELDLGGTIRATAENGYIDVRTQPERRNAAKVLILFDIGGSMDGHVKMVEELFSAAKSEFKHLDYFYFHNCIYEGLWRDNARRWDEKVSTWDVMNTYGADYKCIFVGDAAMSPYEVVSIGGANEYWNAESGETWLRRLREKWPSSVWLNPVPERQWGYTQSTNMIQTLFDERMYPMTLDGIGRSIKDLGR